ncbi:MULTISPECIES: DUF4332 domain-containing protein [Candidatus Nitrosocaldus]|jgi:predicted flap endonuclease-1-like 5' DNA nuclease|uniref:DUF4332 domain-containing protein n=1 Tax=Candidatus Nitrosocaldus cavascurensis TaxID=2058097 RepID=A0A2K5APF1_9ARCH|nr:MULTISPECIES: DUF4332 domain-containing protein [Candidatus Nitrosocaldus]SPC33497.1 protein of unknown function [Candidatus Nitrosocaldus cavascurensis]
MCRIWREEVSDLSNFEDLQKILKTLREENEVLRQRVARMAELEKENEALKNRIAEMSKSFTLTVEPATLIKAIQSDLLKVDEFALKQERSTTYVVSDLNVQLKAVVTQKDDKVALALPSRAEDIRPELLSTINISIKPIPLPYRAGAQPQPQPKPRPVEVIEGIGPKLGSVLRAKGLSTVADLARASARDLTTIGIDEKSASKFIGMARLMAMSEFAGLEGMDEQAAELLVIAGKVDSREMLAKSDPEELFKILDSAIKERRVRVPKGYRLSIEDVRRWIDSARKSVGS